MAGNTGMTAYERHLHYIESYVHHYGGQHAARDEFEARKTLNDAGVLREEHRFLWGAEDMAGMTAEKEFALKYYTKLFKEYALADVSRCRKAERRMRRS